MRKSVVIPMSAILILGCLTGSGQSRNEERLPAPLRQELVRSMEKGLAYLHQTQKPDGSWENYPGITALAATALLKAPGFDPKNPPENMTGALEHLVRLAKPNGAIYDRDLPNYNTAVCIVALLASGNPKYEPVIKKAQQYLADLQFDEGEGYAKENPYYGGVGYNKDMRPDLPNLQHSLEALKESALPADHPVWEKAIRFLQRAQNRKESNDQSYAGDDGGFMYGPGMGFRGSGTQSYGSMTYAGLLSYSYANLKKEDPRVEAALDWIRQHYTVDENPGMGQKTLYYYYLVFAKALRAYGEATVTDASGVRHNWREDLGRKILQLQHPEGFWVNEDPTEWQDNKVLVTSFTVLALQHLLAD